MAFSLKVGRRPAKGYKGQMRLAQAYQKLQWGEPLAYERAALGDTAPPAQVRGIGTSAHMLIELYLDMYAARSAQFGRPQFLVECLHPEQGSYLREWLETIHGALDLDVSLDCVQFFPRKKNLDILRGRVWYSWAVFCDHSVKEENAYHVERNVGPYGLIRRLSPEKGRKHPFWKAYDRDGRFIVALTEEGKSELMDTATCPITLGGVRPTTYPASPLLGTEVPVRLRKAFER